MLATKYTTFHYLIYLISGTTSQIYILDDSGQLSETYSLICHFTMVLFIFIVYISICVCIYTCFDIYISRIVRLTLSECSTTVKKPIIDINIVYSWESSYELTPWWKYDDGVQTFQIFIYEYKSMCILLRIKCRENKCATWWKEERRERVREKKKEQLYVHDEMNENNDEDKLWNNLCPMYYYEIFRFIMI